MIGDGHLKTQVTSVRVFRKRHTDYWRGDNLKKRYGITLDDYGRILAEQDGRCAICGGHQSKQKHRLSVDHDHATGEIRGLLCTRCNVFLGRIESPEGLLNKALEYLKDHK